MVSAGPTSYSHLAHGTGQGGGELGTERWNTTARWYAAQVLPAHPLEACHVVEVTVPAQER